MLIHIGAGYLVRGCDIVGIFDIDGQITPKITSEFLKSAQKRNITDTAGEDLPRSFVLTEKDGRERVILSHISSQTLHGRTQTRAPRGRGMSEMGDTAKTAVGPGNVGDGEPP